MRAPGGGAVTEPRRLRSAVLPAAAFGAAVTAHVAWRGLFPEAGSEPGLWAPLPSRGGWLRAYLDSGDAWLGYSYGLAAAFTAAAARSFLEDRSRASRRWAVGGAALTGSLAAAGCFLVGCCGSPMLAVWLGLFGAACLPLAKPLLAAATTASVALGWWLMARRRGRPEDGGKPCLACDADRGGTT